MFFAKRRDSYIKIHFDYWKNKVKRGKKKTFKISNFIEIFCINELRFLPLFEIVFLIFKINLKKCLSTSNIFSTLATKKNIQAQQEFIKMIENE